MKRDEERAPSSDIPADEKPIGAPDGVTRRPALVGSKSERMDPFSTFEEWHDPANTKAYAEL
jgi:hypothetical protein